MTYPSAQFASPYPSPSRRRRNWFSRILLIALAVMALMMVSAPGDRVRYTLIPLSDFESADNWPFIQWVMSQRGGASVTIASSEQSLLLNIVIPLIPWLLIFGFIWLFVFRHLRSNSAQTRAIPVYQVPPPVTNAPSSNP